MRHAGEDKEEIGRCGFLKLGFAGILGTVLLFISGCTGKDDDGGRRKRRRR
jgi:hypothetical protein